MFRKNVTMKWSNNNNIIVTNINNESQIGINIIKVGVRRNDRTAAMEELALYNFHIAPC